jgi:aerobic carbon-monoxide dehydrogenase medium subunit
VTPFTYLEPATLSEALDHLAQYGDDAKVIAGGTALVNFMKSQLIQPRVVIGLRRLRSLEAIVGDGEIKMGALTTLHAIETSALIARTAPVLVEACQHVATIRIRMMATIGGAMAYADPSLDTPPALIAVDARIKTSSRRGEREIPIRQFFTGIFETVLEPDELVTEITIPRQPAGAGFSFIKFLPTTHDDYPTVSVAVRVTVSDGMITDARIALGAVGTTPVHAEEAEVTLRGMKADESNYREAGEVAAAELEPLADFRGSSEYKRDMAAVHVRRALAAAAARASV